MDSRRATASWIDADEPPAFELVNPRGRSRAILTCDHASARIPRSLGDLGLAAADRLRHVAWDIGTAPLARRLARILDAPLVLSGYSRLVVDCNRPLEVASAFCVRSEDVDVPGNHALSDAEKAARAPRRSTGPTRTRFMISWNRGWGETSCR